MFSFRNGYCITEKLGRQVSDGRVAPSTIPNSGKKQQASVISAAAEKLRNCKPCREIATLIWKCLSRMKDE